MLIACHGSTPNVPVADVRRVPYKSVDANLEYPDPCYNRIRSSAIRARGSPIRSRFRQLSSSRTSLVWRDALVGLASAMARFLSRYVGHGYTRFARMAVQRRHGWLLRVQSMPLNGS